MRLRIGLAIALTLALAASFPGGAAGAGPATAPEFGPYTTVPLGHDTDSLGVADFTGDGIVDVVATVTGKITQPQPLDEYALVVFPGSGDGSFGVPTERLPVHASETTGHPQLPVAVGDLTADGQADVAVATGPGVQLFVQRPEGGLVGPVLIPTTSPARQVVIADLELFKNEPDLIVGTDTEILYFKNLGVGGVLVPGAYSVPPKPILDMGVTELAVGNVTGDPALDVVAVKDDSLLVIETFPQARTSAGVYPTDFGPADEYGSPIDPGQESLDEVDVAEVTGDGQEDVVVAVKAYGAQARLLVYRQKVNPPAEETSLFDDPDVYPVPGEFPATVVGRDLEEDTQEEVFVLRDGSVAMLRGRSDGTLGTACALALPYAQYASADMVVEDLNADGRLDIAAVADAPDGLVVALQREPSAGASALSLNPAASSSKVKQTIKLSGALDLSGACPIAGQSVKVFRTAPGGSETTIGTVTTDATGAFSLTDVPKQAGKFSYRAFWSGDARRPDASSSLVSVSVSRIKTTVTGKLSGGTKGGGQRLYAAGKKASFTATLTPASPGQRLEVVVQRRSGGRWKTVRRITKTVSGAGQATAKIKGKAGRTYRVKAVFDQDDVHAGDASAWRKFRFQG